MPLLMLSLLIWAAGAPDHVIVDNARVTVREVSWAKGERLDASPGLDRAIVYLAGGRVGDAVFETRQARNAAPASADSRAIVVDLKDGTAPRYANTSGYPAAFPRPGARKLIDNDRVIVWDYTWTPGRATPVHFHDKDVVVVYLADGELTSTTPDGVSVVNPHSFGFTKFNPGNRVHTETLSRGKARAVIIELK
jgi:hypothetical protein